MSKITIFIDVDFKKGMKLEIPIEESLHLNVKRIKKNEKIFILNGKGFEATGIIDIKDKTITIEEIYDITNRELPVKINIFMALINYDKFEFAIQKTTELGVNSIIPLITKRVQVRWNSKKLKRFIRIAKEAIKQSGRALLPKIEEPIKLKDIKKIRNGIVLWEKSTKSLKDEILKIVSTNPEEINVVIGPEGGFEEDEIKLLEEKGFEDVSLGKVILRSETSAIYIVSVLRYMLAP
ncbi:MAG: RsmE family RNA methyltransferase [Thermosulfidibacteraceae bacterium]|jgi:16S rRNA (uracil1498-N3)-methyltransferase